MLGQQLNKVYVFGDCICDTDIIYDTILHTKTGFLKRPIIITTDDGLYDTEWPDTRKPTYVIKKCTLPVFQLRGEETDLPNEKSWYIYGYYPGKEIITHTIRELLEAKMYHITQEDMNAAIESFKTNDFNQFNSIIEEYSKNTDYVGVKEKSVAIRDEFEKRLNKKYDRLLVIPMHIMENRIVDLVQSFLGIE